MYSLYRDKRKVQSKVKQTRSERRLQAAKQKRNDLSEKSHHRVGSWTAECLNEELWNSIRQGSTPLLHPAHHKFREDDLGTKANIYIKRYYPSSQRAEQEEVDYKNSHLPLEGYKVTSPHNTSTWLRAEDKSKHLVPRTMLLNSQFTQSRLDGVAKASKVYNFEIIDKELIDQPVWRRIEKERWSSPGGFNRHTKPLTSVPWKTPEYMSEGLYVGGYTEIGDVSRVRDKDKEISTTKNSMRQMTSCTSLRSLHSDRTYSRQIQLSSHHSLKAAISTSSSRTRVYPLSAATHMAHIKEPSFTQLRMPLPY